MTYAKNINIQKIEIENIPIYYVKLGIKSTNLEASYLIHLLFVNKHFLKREAVDLIT